jgi:hypothetical protein
MGKKSKERKRDKVCKKLDGEKMGRKKAIA